MQTTETILSSFKQIRKCTGKAMGNLKDLTQRLKNLDSETKPVTIQARQSELQLKLLVVPAGGDTTVSVTRGQRCWH